MPTSNEAKSLLALWKELKESLFWQTYIQAAAEDNITVLKRLPEVIVMLRHEPVLHRASSGVEQQLGSLGLGVEEGGGSSTCGNC